MIYSFEVSVKLHDDRIIFEKGQVIVNNDSNLIKTIVDITSSRHYGCQSVGVISINANTYQR